MIALIKGRLVLKSEAMVVVETAGVGYRLQISEQSARKLPALDGEVTLWVTTRIKDEVIQLFGFAERREQDLFQQLIKVSGVGPKLAMAMISATEHEDLLTAIISKNTARLAKIPGVGKKLSQRLVLELAEAMEKELGSGLVVGRSDQTASSAHLSADLTAALTSLGYSEREFVQPAAALIKQHPEAGLEDLIRLVLRELHGNS